MPEEPSTQSQNFANTGKLEFTNSDLLSQTILNLAAGDSFTTFYNQKGTYRFVNIHGKTYFCQDGTQLSCVDLLEREDIAVSSPHRIASPLTRALRRVLGGIPGFEE